MDEQKKSYKAKKSSKRITIQDEDVLQMASIMPDTSILYSIPNEKKRNYPNISINQFKKALIRQDLNEEQSMTAWRSNKEGGDKKVIPEEKNQPFFKINELALPTILKKDQPEQDQPVRTNWGRKQVMEANNQLMSQIQEESRGRRNKRTTGGRKQQDCALFPKLKPSNHQKEQEKQIQNNQLVENENVNQHEKQQDKNKTPLIDYLPTNQYKNNANQNIFVTKGSIFAQDKNENQSIFTKSTSIFNTNLGQGQKLARNTVARKETMQHVENYRQAQQVSENISGPVYPQYNYNQQIYQQINQDELQPNGQPEQQNEQFKQQQYYEQQQQFYEQQYMENQQQYNQLQQYNPYPPNYNDYQQQFQLPQPTNSYTFEDLFISPFSEMHNPFNTYCPFQNYVNNLMPYSNTINQLTNKMTDESDHDHDMSKVRRINPQLSEQDKIYAQYNRLDQNIFAKYYNLKYQMRAPQLQTDQLGTIFTMRQRQQQQELAQLAGSINQFQYNQGYQHQLQENQRNKEQEKWLQIQLQSKLQQCQQLQTITDNMLLQFYFNNADYIEKMEEVGKFYQLKKHINSTVLRQQRTIAMLEQQNAALESKIEAIERGLDIPTQEHMQNYESQEIPYASWWSQSRKPLRKRPKCPDRKRKEEIIKIIEKLQRETEQIIEAKRSRQNIKKGYRFDPQLSSSCSSKARNSESIEMTKMRYIYGVLEMAESIIQKLNQQIN